MGRWVTPAAALLLLGASDGAAISLWRDKLASRWAQGPGLLEGKGQAWKDAPELEEPGLSFRAVNDGEYLYLMATSLNREGRALLSGIFRQDFTLWFLRPDGKTRAWGLRLPFSALEAPPGVSWEDVRHPEEGVPVQAPTPVTIGASALEWSANTDYKADLAAREPVHVFRVPLGALGVKRFGTVPISFESSPPSAEVQRQFEERRANAPPPSAWQRPPQDSGKTKAWITVTAPESAWPGGEGARALNRRRGYEGPAAAREMLLPDPLAVRFTVKLAADPAQGRRSSH